MDFFEKLGKKATETFNSAGEKANKIAGDAKLKIKINECKSKIKDAYQDIGKIVYQKYVLDGNLDVKEEIKDQLDKISALTDDIEKYENERLQLSNMKQCEKCKTKIDKNAKFCPSCGAEQPEEPIQEAEVLNEEAENANEVENNEQENKPDEITENTVVEVSETVSEESEENENKVEE